MVPLPSCTNVCEQDTHILVLLPNACTYLHEVPIRGQGGYGGSGHRAVRSDDHDLGGWLDDLLKQATCCVRTYTLKTIGTHQ